MLIIYLVKYGLGPGGMFLLNEIVYFPWHSQVMAYLPTAQLRNTKEGGSEENCRYVENQDTGSSYCPLLKLSNLC